MPRRKTPPPLGQQIRAVRKERGKSQAELAEALGVGQSRVSDYELGRTDRILTVKQLVTIVKFLRARFCLDTTTMVFEAEP